MVIDRAYAGRQSRQSRSSVGLRLKNFWKGTSINDCCWGTILRAGTVSSSQCEAGHSTRRLVTVPQYRGVGHPFRHPISTHPTTRLRNEPQPEHGRNTSGDIPTGGVPSCNPNKRHLRGQPGEQLDAITPNVVRRFARTQKITVHSNI